MGHAYNNLTNIKRKIYEISKKERFRLREREEQKSNANESKGKERKGKEDKTVSK